MTLAVSHAFVSGIADGADATLVRPTNWNASHTLTGVADVTQGGTGLSGGSSGGVLYFDSATTTASSAALTANRLVVGGGAGAAPSVLAAGTTSTVLHGNAGGAPSFSAVSLTADVSGILPQANGGAGGASHFSYKSGYLYSAIHSTAADVVTSANSLTATAVNISQQITIDALGVYVVAGDAAAGAKSVNLAIYDDSSGVPGNQVARLNAVLSVSVSTVEATGALNGGNQTLNPGRYWLAALYSGTPTIRGVTALDYTMASIKGGTLMVRQTSASSNFIAFTGSATYPNFPNSNGAFGTATESNASTPLVFFRIA